MVDKKGINKKKTGGQNYSAKHFAV